MSAQVQPREDNKRVTRWDLFIAWLRWCLVVEVPVSFDRMQALGFCYSLNKVLRKIYKDDKEGLQNAMRRHVRLFNTNPDWGSIIHGIIISLEEQRASGNEEITDEMIESLKIGLMGPLAGIGDSVDQGIVMTIPLAIFVPMALDGSMFAAVMPTLIFIIWAYGFSYFLFNRGYKLGRESVMTILRSGAIKKVIDIASIVGLFMIGCLSAAYVQFETILTYSSEAETVMVQELIDNMLPNLLPFALVMGIYYYIEKRGPNYLRIILYIMAFALIMTLIGVI